MSSRRTKNKLLITRLHENIIKIIDEHGLSRDDSIVLKEVSFPHGRADVVVYGLYEDLYVVPIGVEVKTEIKSGTELFNYISQMKETYEHAFVYIYLAVGQIRDRVERIAEDYLSQMGYGLIKIGKKSIDIVVKASPKKVYRSKRDYDEIFSRGTLYVAARRILMEEGFDERYIEASSQWLGFKWPINYCAWLYGDYACFGIYSLGLKSIKRVLEFLDDREHIVQNLGEMGYRIYLESYIAVGGVRGYITHLDEPIDTDIVKTINDKIKQGIRPMPVRRWGSGLGIYKRLWNIQTTPSYIKALKLIRETLNSDQLGVLKGVISEYVR